MPPKRRRFTRPLGERRYRKMFVISTEGNITEPQYFNIFNQWAVIHVKCLRSKGDNSPPAVLARMKRYIEEKGLQKWLVVDRDQWNEVHLRELHEWSLQADGYGFALSNPKFEYWLLLHFENGTGVTNDEISPRYGLRWR